MSAEASTAVSSLKRLQAIALPAAFVGVILLGIGFQMDVDPGKKIFWSSYLYGFMVWFSLAIGSTTLIFLHHTIRAQWSLSILRVAEACAKTLPLLAVFFLPLGLRGMVRFTHGQIMMFTTISTRTSRFGFHPPGGQSVVRFTLPTGLSELTT